jgi:fatty acid desaturase
MFLLFGTFMRWALAFPVAKAILAIALVFGLLLVGLYGIVRFILWLIVEPYRAHKRDRETEETAE